MARERPGTFGTPATAALMRAGVTFEVHTYHHDPDADSFGLEAAAALGRPAGQVYKTLLVDTGAGLAVGVVPVDRQLDMKGLAAALGVKKVTMAQPTDAERSSGMVVGGISPVGQRKALPTVLDESIHQHESVLISGGRRGLDIELAPEDLIRLTRGRCAPIARR